MMMNVKSKISARETVNIQNIIDVDILIKQILYWIQDFTQISYKAIMEQ